MSGLKRPDAGSKTMSVSEVKRAKQETYIHWLRQRVSRPAKRDEELYARAWKVARAAAELLRERYHVTRIRAFGSLVHPERFHRDSDVDLAVDGLLPADYWEAATETLFLDEHIRVELIDRAVCRASLWETVERDGVDL